MPDRSGSFDFLGTAMHVTATADEWVEGMISAFPDFVADGELRGDVFSLRIIQTDKLPDPPGFPLTWEGRMPDGYQGRILEAEDEAYLTVEDRVAVSWSYRYKDAKAFVLPDSQSEFFTSAAIAVIDAALARDGQYLLHGACLVDRQSNRVILICAPSGAGKTTTSMALAHDGFSLVTDDASVVIPAGSAALAWGLPRALKVHWKTAELLPWVGQMQDCWDASGEQAVPLADLAGRLSTAKPAAREVAAVVLLGQRSAGGHVVERLSKADLLMALAHDNVAARPGGMTIKAQARFEALAEVVARVPALMLSAGTELRTLPGILAEALEQHAPQVVAR
ncbi:hypothetical protein [Mesorhizobium sp. 10J20-29]